MAANSKSHAVSQTVHVGSQNFMLSEGKICHKGAKVSAKVLHSYFTKVLNYKVTLQSITV